MKKLIAVVSILCMLSLTVIPAVGSGEEGIAPANFFPEFEAEA